MLGVRGHRGNSVSEHQMREEHRLLCTRRRTREASHRGVGEEQAVWTDMVSFFK